MDQPMSSFVPTSRITTAPGLGLRPRGGRLSEFPALHLTIDKSRVILGYSLVERLEVER